MAEEVANVMLLGAGLEQAAREFTSQVMEAQTGDTRALARAIPRHLDRFDLFAAFIAEHEGRGGMLGSVRCVLAHGQFRTQSRSDGNHAGVVGLGLRRRQDDPSRFAVLVSAHLRPLQ